MKAFAVIGYHHTGKTTVVTALIKLLRARGFTVSTLKDIHSEAFKADTEGKNTWQHMAAGASQVFAKGQTDSSLIFDKSLELNQILPLLDCDYLIIEGMKSAPVPKILCADSIEQLEELYDDTVIAISGKIATQESGWAEPPIFDINTAAEELCDLVTRQVFDILPVADPDCCHACGLSCYELAAAILRGDKQRSDCVMDAQKSLRLSIDGKEVVLVPFVQNLFKDMIKAFVGNLKHANPAGKITIEL